jgi:hypothetical protein
MLPFTSHEGARLTYLQMCKYVAKFRLLEHGLLDAALAVDDILMPNEKNDEKGETTEDFQQRVNLFVAVYMSRASDSDRHHHKDGAVYQSRKDVIFQFLKATSLKQCQNERCGA